MSDAKTKQSADKPDEPAKRSKPRRVLRVMRRLIVWVSIGLLVFVAGFALYAWQINWRGERAVNQIKEELAERELLDLFLKPTTNEEVANNEPNGTSAAYWRAAMQARPAAGDRPLLSVGTVVINDIEPRQQYHPEMIAALREVFEKYPRFLQLVQDARNAPPSTFNLGQDLADPTSGLELLGNTRSVARWLEERARLAEIDQDGEAYVRSITGILALSDLLNQDSQIITALVSGSIDALARHATMDGLSRIELSADQLDKLIAAFDRRRSSMDVLRWVGNDLSWQYHHCLVDVKDYLRLVEAKQSIMLRQLQMQQPDWVDTSALPSTTDLLWRDVILTTCPGRYELLHAAYMKESLEYYDQLEKYKDTPKQRWAWLSSTYQRQRDEDDDKTRSLYETRGMAGNNVITVARSFANMESRLAVGVAALQVERYRVIHDRWPSQLADATGDHPIDGFGESLRYRAIPEGVMIYSVGYNTIDEQGFNDQEYIGSDQYPDADDFPVLLYNPELRNTIPPPADAVKDYDDWSDFEKELYGPEEED